MLHKYWRWLQLGMQLLWCNPARACLLLRLAAWTIVVSVLTKRFSLPRVLQFVATPRRRPAHAIPPQELAALTDRLLSINRWVFTPTCWKRSMLLHRYLALNGVATRLVFGIERPTGSTLAGHSWLELHEQPFLEAQAPHYLVTYSFGSSDFPPNGGFPSVSRNKAGHS